MLTKLTPLLAIAGGTALAAGISLLFSVLTHALRDLSRARLEAALERRGREDQIDPLMNHAAEVAFVASTIRLFANFAVLVLLLHVCLTTAQPPVLQYTEAAIIAGIVTLFTSVLLPQALARYSGEVIVASLLPLLRVMRFVATPLTRLMNAVDDLVRRATGASLQAGALEVEQDILQVVEEGQKGGFVDQRERAMIERVMELGNRTAVQAMTARPEIVALAITAPLELVRQTIERTGHSRLPVYDGTLDHVVGVLHARDLLRYVGVQAQPFELKQVIRPPLFVPETKPLTDLLQEFRQQKVHIAIVLDEYGAATGLVTIEDIFEELVGEIGDEHEPVTPNLFKRLGERAAEVDARIYIGEVNRLMDLALPEDAGFDTLGGFVSSNLGRIPQSGTSFQYHDARFTVIDAEPRKVNRVRIELLTQPAGHP